MTLPETRTSAVLYRRVAITAALLVVGLITLGGVVRITGSGLGCGEHWPLCDGQWFPPLDLKTFIEISHRWVAGLVTVAVFTLLAVALRRHADQPALRRPAVVAAVLLVIQVLLGPVIVKLNLPPAVVIVHLLNAMVLLGVLVVAVLRAGEGSTVGRLVAEPPSRRAAEPPNIPAVKPSLIHFAAALGFLTIALGALTANLDAGMYCLGFPLCGGSAAPPATTLGLVQWVHRLLAFTFLGTVVLLAARGRSLSPGPRSIHRATSLLLGATLMQVAVAAAMILNLLPTGLRALHLLVGSLVWVSLVVLVYRAGEASATAPTAEPPSHPAGEPSLISDLITLTKPRIISLLLLTTVAPMFITGHGLPSAELVFWVCVGGYLMAGGANAINMWFDRDIDDRMARTKLRPIPSGRISPAAGLLFGLALGGLAFWVFWRLVNPLSAWLALGGLLFYVLIYTMLLKRWGPQNIVIGGAAGAFPPLVGWAAVAGSLDLAALYLFAIIFFWTPPHFWALALIKQSDYAKAGVPMMPNVHGEHWTKVQMLAYTLMLLPLTLMPSVFGALGVFYAIAAALLGGRLLWYCIRLLRESSVTPTAWKMYKYSLLYLALLFVAMGVDRALPFGHGFERKPILILDRPETEALGPAGAAR